MTGASSQPPNDRESGFVADTGSESLPSDETRRQELLEREDDVVQQLTAAKFALALGDVAAADAAVDAALSNSRRTITDLVDVAAEQHAGKLIRTQPSTPVKPPPQRPRRDAR
jgi:hypothetical protein